MDGLIEKCHVGIGSLALFRNSMKEACTLKVREYWARGLPFVVGYEDTDLKDNVRMQPFYLKLNVQRNQDRPEFDLALIVSFAQQVCGIPDYPEKMRALAEEYIGYPVKAGAYVNFFKTLSR